MRWRPLRGCVSLQPEGRRSRSQELTELFHERPQSSIVDGRNELVVQATLSKSVQPMATSIFSRASTMYGTQRESNSLVSIPGFDSSRSTCLIACLPKPPRARGNPWPMVLTANDTRTSALCRNRARARCWRHLRQGLRASACVRDCGLKSRTRYQFP
jgi:hypothetical protein